MNEIIKYGYRSIFKYYSEYCSMDFGVDSS